MVDMPIFALLPSSGAVPTNGYDATSQAAYTQWELNDEAHFSVPVPDAYRPGSDFFLSIQESTGSISRRHKWQVTTLLLRPGVHATGEFNEVETFTHEYESPAVADRLSRRVFQVTGATVPGQISDIAITQGDVLSLAMKRIGASTNEDPDVVRIFDLSLSTAVDETSISECAGRVGNIVDTVRDLFNEATGGFLSDDFIIRSINRCREEVAQENYWRRETWIPAYSGENEVNLLAVLADYQDVHQVRFSGQDHPMTPLPSFKEYQELKSASNGPGTPEYYVVQNDLIYVWPRPQADLQSGYGIYHSYLPQELTCSSANPNPPIPRAHDMLFVYFTLKQAFLRDRHAPGADVKFQEYLRLYEHEKAKLLGEGDPPALAVRSYR